MGRLGVGAGRFDGKDGYGPIEIEEREIFDARASTAQLGPAGVRMASDAFGQGRGERRVLAGKIQKDLAISYIDAEAAHAALVGFCRFAAEQVDAPTVKRADDGVIRDDALGELAAFVRAPIFHGDNGVVGQAKERNVDPAAADTPAAAWGQVFNRADPDPLFEFWIRD